MEVERHKGYIVKFDMGRNTGIISGRGGVKYEFTAQDFVEKIDNLLHMPGVSFERLNGRAVRIANDSTLPKIREKLSSGLAILGAAKCPNCTWRLPMNPQAEIPKFRRITQGRCPNCQASIQLISIFKGFHNQIAVGIIVVPFIARFIFARLAFGLDEQMVLIFNVMSFLLYPAQFLLFFYVFFQEKFVKSKDVEVFR